MQTALVNSKSESDLELLLHIAEKLGMKAKLLTEEELEEIGLANAMKIGRTKSYLKTEAFLKKFENDC